MPTLTFTATCTANFDALARVVPCRLARERGMRNGMSC